MRLPWRRRTPAAVPVPNHWLAQLWADATHAAAVRKYMEDGDWMRKEFVEAREQNETLPAWLRGGSTVTSRDPAAGHVKETSYRAAKREFTEVKDSGERQKFDTGSQRDTQEGKGRFDLLPPYAVGRLARHFENGAVKYGDRNWERGQPTSRYMDSALRHIFAFVGGDTSEDHLAAGAWNLLAAIETENRVETHVLPAYLLDLPHQQRELTGQSRQQQAEHFKEEAVAAAIIAVEEMTQDTGRDAADIDAATDGCGCPSAPSG